MKPSETAEAKITNYSIIQSPLGELILVADSSALTGLYFVECSHIPAASSRWTLKPHHPVFQVTETQLQEYFEGKRISFSVPLHPAGTDFQEKIWHEIALVPYGQTITYSELAQRAGSPAAIRAAGAATGRNPISIIVPCHRIMGKNGSMTGFAGGLERKRHLLQIENSIPQPRSPAKRITGHSTAKVEQQVLVL